MHSDSEPVLTNPAMLFSEITCTYDEDVANLFEAGSKGFQLDPVATANKNDQVEDGAITDLGITVAVYQKVSGSYVAVTDTDSVVVRQVRFWTFTSKIASHTTTSTRPKKKTATRFSSCHWRRTRPMDSTSWSSLMTIAR